MSVTFYDANNPAQYNLDGDQIGGGVEVNFNNGNAATILQLMGLYSNESASGIYGELDGESFRKSVFRGLANMDILAGFSHSKVDPLYQINLRRRLERLLTAFADSILIRWE